MSDKLSKERTVISMAVMAMQANNRFDEETAERLLQVFDAGYMVLEAKLSKMEGALERIVEWSKAYPLDVFPEPDFKKAAKVLKDNGMTLDAVSASNMRHVITEVAGMAKEALAGESDD